MARDNRAEDERILDFWRPIFWRTIRRECFDRADYDDAFQELACSLFTHLRRDPACGNDVEALRSTITSELRWTLYRKEAKRRRSLARVWRQVNEAESDGRAASYDGAHIGRMQLLDLLAARSIWNYLPDGMPGTGVQPDVTEEAVSNAYVDRLIGRLPEPFQTIVRLRYCEGIEAIEISRLLRINYGTVKSRLSRARDRLRCLAQEQPMNQPLADAAVKAITDASVEGRRGFCSRFVRQVVERVYGPRYDGLFGGTAIETGDRFAAAGLARESSQAGALQVGDILVCRVGHGPFGHIGIYCGHQGVAENSSRRSGRIEGAKGYCTVPVFDSPYPHDLVGRLPVPAQAGDHYGLVLKGQSLAVLTVQNGQALCPVRLFGKALGIAVDWNADTQHVVLDGREIVATVTVTAANVGLLPIRTLAQAAGLPVAVDETAHTIAVG